jgi:hypothetical protein
MLHMVLWRLSESTARLQMLDKQPSSLHVPPPTENNIVRQTRTCQTPAHANPKLSLNPHIHIQPISGLKVHKLPPVLLKPQQLRGPQLHELRLAIFKHKLRLHEVVSLLVV